MKKILSFYYVLLEILFIISFISQENQIIFEGFLYHLIMISLILFTIIIIIKFNCSLKFKKTFYALTIFNFLIIENKYLFILTIILFFIIGILNNKNKFINIIFLGSLFSAIIVTPITFIIIIGKLAGFSPRDKMDKKTFVKCGNYDTFLYSAGAMDSMHYAVIKKKKILYVNGLIEIWQDKQIIDNYKDYNNFINNHNCN